MKQAAIIRLLVLLFLVLNQSLVMFGLNPLPFSEEQVYEGLSTIALIVMSTWSWYKNAPITQEAQATQVLLEEMKEGRLRV